MINYKNFENLIIDIFNMREFKSKYITISFE